MPSAENDKLWGIIWLILFPPVAVALITRSGGQACINTILLLLFIVPGYIHGIYVLCKSDEYRRTTQ
ncbi:unnamed protein product, partial [Mesorhabditis spiculigera]